MLLLRGDRRVSVDDLGEDSTGRLDTEGERENINQNNISKLHDETKSAFVRNEEHEKTDSFFSGENTSLYSSSPSDSLIGVDSLGGLFAVEVFLDEFLNLGNSGRSSDETVTSRRQSSYRVQE